MSSDFGTVGASQGEWDRLVPGEEYSSQIQDQSIRQNLADELVPPGTSSRREARRFTPFTRSHCPLSLASSHSARAPPPTVSDDDGGLERQQAARMTDSVMGRTAAANPEAGRAATVDPEERRAAAADPEARRATATTGEGECFDGGGGRRLGNGGFGGAATTTTSECECSGCGSVDDDEAGGDLHFFPMSSDFGTVGASQGEWDRLVPGEEYSSQIQDQSIRQNLADELVPPGTSSRREARRFTPFTRSHCPLSLASSHSARAPPPTVSDDDGGLERQQAARMTDSVMGRTAAANPEAGRAATVDPEERRAAAADPEARRATATTGEGECFDGGGGRRLGNGGFGGAATTTTSECECSGCGSVDDDGR
uniref:Uncharacterized protein n=1 Tax=Oryza barthii TaxID=65489 RepID=A0A0D3H810_9ORYZ